MRKGSLFRSFNHAISGLIHAIKKEENLQIHIFVAIAILVLSLFLDISRLEMVALIFAIGLVLVSEMFNTSFEGMMDIVRPENHPEIKVYKDVAAGAVFVSTVVAVIIGYLVFYPRLKESPISPLISRLRDAPEYISLIALLVLFMVIVIIKAILRRGTPLMGGMPSGHAAASFSIWVMVSFVSENLLVSLLVLIMAIMISIGRVRIGVHTHLEVFVGAVIGGLLTLLFFQIFG